MRSTKVQWPSVSGHDRSSLGTTQPSRPFETVTAASPYLVTPCLWFFVLESVDECRYGVNAFCSEWQMSVSDDHDFQSAPKRQEFVFDGSGWAYSRLSGILVIQSAKEVSDYLQHCWTEATLVIPRFATKQAHSLCFERFLVFLSLLLLLLETGLPHCVLLVPMIRRASRKRRARNVVLYRYIRRCGLVRIVQKARYRSTGVAASWATPRPSSIVAMAHVAEGERATDNCRECAERREED